MYLAPTPDTVGEVLQMAVAAGVRQVVDLSGEPESWWGSVCDAVEASGLAWTHLWPGDFMENATAWAPQLRATGEIREPFPHSASAPVAMDDIAAVAAAVLMADKGTYDGRALALTGPETLTRLELVQRIGDALGRHIPFVEVSRDEAVEAFASAMGDGAAWYVDNVLAEHPMQATSVVQELTGAPATTFAEWAHAHAARFR